MSEDFTEANTFQPLPPQHPLISLFTRTDGTCMLLIFFLAYFVSCADHFIVNKQLRLSPGQPLLFMIIIIVLAVHFSPWHADYLLFPLIGVLFLELYLLKLMRERGDMPQFRFTTLSYVLGLSFYLIRTFGT